MSMCMCPSVCIFVHLMLKQGRFGIEGLSRMWCALWKWYPATERAPGRSFMTVCRAAPRTDAIMALGVDELPPEHVLAELPKLPGIVEFATFSE